MKLIGLAIAAALAASAATIGDVHVGETERMDPGDTLSFEVLNLSLPATAESFCFQLLSQPFDSAARFEADLAFPDGLELAFSDLEISYGVFAGAGYSGPVSSISGWLPLSQNDFQCRRATLVIRDLGSPITVGLPGYELPQDLFVTFISGSSAAGGVTGLCRRDPPPAAAPESSSGVLAGLGALLCTGSVGLKRFSKRRI